MFSGFPERDTRFIAIPDRSRIKQMTQMAQMKACVGNAAWRLKLSKPALLAG